VTLRVSSGPGKRNVPLVVGLSLRHATSALQKAGLFADSTTQNSPTVKKGIVISADPPEGSSVDAGTHVRLVVSSGPVQVKVPDVTGMDTSAAHSALRNAGLSFTDTGQTSDQPKGTVISQSPVSGNTVDKGSTVALTISKGPNTANVPDVTGQPPDQATATLQAAGFKVQVKDKATTNQSQDGTVVHQRPAAGTKLKKGRTVVIYVGRFTQPPTTTSPNTPAEPTPTVP
jgi:serine/threonine-protein kinase